MINRLIFTTLLTVILGAAWLAPAIAQDQAPAIAPDQQPPSEPVYKPPPRGAPGGRVGGASRGTIKATVPLPTIQLLAPDQNAGLTMSAEPTLYFFVSGPVSWRTQFTVSAPNVPQPIGEVDIPAPGGAGIYSVHTADYHVRLEPGVLYTWSISIILNPKSRSRDIVASATLLRTAPEPVLETALHAAPAKRRAALLAQAGIWYDAVTAAAETEASDRHAALDALMNEVGLVEPARYDRQAAGNVRSR